MKRDINNEELNASKTNFFTFVAPRGCGGGGEGRVTFVSVIMGCRAIGRHLYSSQIALYDVEDSTRFIPDPPPVIAHMFNDNVVPFVSDR